MYVSLMYIICVLCSIVEHKTGGDKSDWKSVYRINDKVSVARGVASY